MQLSAHSKKKAKRQLLKPLDSRQLVNAAVKMKESGDDQPLLVADKRMVNTILSTVPPAASDHSNDTKASSTMGSNCFWNECVLSIGSSILL
mmetsp:Transcript_6791/g.11225  ORF Transcript_6791/g.11225 Transcript_6791/m.11225 type:complete len:92 (-) Transcript_6791:634-909(-)